MPSIHCSPCIIDVPSLRYSAGNVGLNTSGVHVDGLCPHHEKALAEQFVANQLAGLQFAGKRSLVHVMQDIERGTLKVK